MLCCASTRQQEHGLCGVQASSEHSLCFAVRAADSVRAQHVLRAKFAESIRAGRVQDVELVPDCAVLAAVGQRMAENRGIAATVFSALATAGVNIKAMAQGSSEYNITVAVAQDDIRRGLRAVHSRFFLSATAVNVALVGPGQVGRELLRQLARQRGELRARFNVDVRLLAIASSRRMLLSDRGARPLCRLIFCPPRRCFLTRLASPVTCMATPRRHSSLAL